MNTKKISNPVRVIAFFLTAVILVCTFGFTVDGWQNDDEQRLPNSELTDKDSDRNNNESTDTGFAPEEPEIYVPEYINSLTGLEVSEEVSHKVPLAFLMEWDDNCYGISSSDILVEIPIENGGSRLISFITDRQELWKIGSLTSGRKYIINVAKFFGGIPVFNGIDDQISYPGCEIDLSFLDLKQQNGYHYTEFSSKVYTNCDLISAGINASGIRDTVTEEANLPYSFNEFGSDLLVFEKNAKIVKITTDNESIELRYNKEASNYSFLKSGSIITDALNGRPLNFTNCLVLFADSITYDNMICNQMVMDTIGNGAGYYITNGSFTEIKWTATEAGIMSFYLPGGERLTINRGNSYICYLKSSKMENVSFS